MIYKYEDFLDELSKLHPEVTMKSLSKIVKSGLQGIHRGLIDGFEIELEGDSLYADGKDWFKFIRQMTPEEQYKHSMKKYNIKKKRRETLTLYKDGNKASDQ